MSIAWWLPALAAPIAAALMPLAIRSRHLGHDHDFHGVQKVHDVPTSRLGGVNVFLAYAAALALAGWFGSALFEGWPILLCSLPVVLIGLREDLVRGVHPWHRLGGAVIAGALASYFAMGTIARLDLPFVDGWLHYYPFALGLTVFMVAGACNAVNLIDGAHGLAGGTTLMMFGGLAAAAAIAGDAAVLQQALAMMCAIVGFMVWNYPRGKVFLGDAGAYFLGFMYAQLSIQIVTRNSGISAWLVIALAAYPITETLYSMYRRKLVLRTASMQPDAGHLHSLVFRRLVAQGHSAHAAESVRHANARVAPRMWVHGAICLVVALAFYAHTPALIAFCGMYLGGYVAYYRMLARGGLDKPEAGVPRAVRRATRGNP